jgi:hypothetical protein
MPQIFRIGSYIIYFWSDENNPLEPVHVHIAEGRASGNATKVWITSAGKALLCNNNSHIPLKTLNNMIRYIEANSGIIINKWYAQFGEIRYYC